MARPTTPPPVTRQDLLEGLQLPHEGGLLPYTNPGHGSAWCAKVSYPEAGKQPWRTAPGPVDMTHPAWGEPALSKGGQAGLGALLPWFELFTEEGSPKVAAQVEFHELGVALLLRSTGGWMLQHSDGNPSRRQQGQLWVWSGGKSGYLVDPTTDGGQMGWGSKSTDGKDFGAPATDSYGGQTFPSRLRVHGWPADEWRQVWWFNHGVAEGGTSDPARVRDLLGVAWWVTCRVVGTDAQKAAYRVQAGVDTGTTANINGGPGRTGWGGRARIVRPEWRTFAQVTLSPAMIDQYPPTIIPGYSPVISPPTPPTPPEPPADTPLPQTYRHDSLNAVVIEGNRYAVASTTTTTVQRSS